MQKIESLPCPFCGSSKGEIIFTKEVTFFKCTNCHARGPTLLKKEFKASSEIAISDVAVFLWNHRN